MIPRTILGIDPGIHKAAYGIIREYTDSTGQKTFKALSAGWMPEPVRIPGFTKSGNKTKKVNLPAHCGAVFLFTRDLTETYQCTQVALEAAIYVQNKQTLIQLAHVRGAMLAGIAEAKVHPAEIHELSPTAIKKAIAGKGNADKGGVLNGVKMFLPAGPVNYNNLDHNCFDALATALTLGLSTKGP